MLVAVKMKRSRMMKKNRRIHNQRKIQVMMKKRNNNRMRAAMNHLRNLNQKISTKARKKASVAEVDGVRDLLRPPPKNLKMM